MTGRLHTWALRTVPALVTCMVSLTCHTAARLPLPI